VNTQSITAPAQAAEFDKLNVEIIVC